MDQRTRGFVHQVKTCRLSVEWATADTFQKTSALEIAEETANARELCDTIRSRLITMNTDRSTAGRKTPSPASMGTGTASTPCL